MHHQVTSYGLIWVVVKIMVPFWVPIIIRHLISRVPKKGTTILSTTHIVGIIDNSRVS